MKKDPALDTRILQHPTKKARTEHSSIRNKLEPKEFKKWNGDQVTDLHESNKIRALPLLSAQLRFTDPNNLLISALQDPARSQWMSTKLSSGGNSNKKWQLTALGVNILYLVHDLRLGDSSFKLQVIYKQLYKYALLLHSKGYDLWGRS